MNNSRILLLTVSLAVAMCFGVLAQDNLRDSATKVTVAEPLQVPGGTVLQPGVYVFRLDESSAYRHIVRISNEDETRRITTVLAIPNMRLEPTDTGIMTYAERPVGEPVALNAWFYSGRTGGHQFVYPKSKAEELSRLNRVEVPSTGSEEVLPNESASSRSQASEPPTAATPRTSPDAGATAARTNSTSPRASASDVNANASRDAVTTARNTASATPPQDASARDQLPRTASSLPFVAVLGTLFLAGALLLRFAVRHQ
jgi:hypothetical protein